MKLSDAIEQGSKLLPRCRVSLFSYTNGKLSGCCPLGAAILAIGGSDNDTYNYLKEKFPIATKKHKHPVEDMNPYVFEIIYMLNDCCGWSVEAIVAWLRKEVEID